MAPGRSSLLHAFDLLRSGREQEAVSLFRDLAARGDPGALATLAELTWRGGLVAQDVFQGREYYRSAAEAGHSGCAAYYTNLLASGIAGPRDWSAALKRLREEARQDPARRRILQLIQGMKLVGDGDSVRLPQGQRLSEDPEVWLFPNAFSAAETDYLRELAEPGYEPSVVREDSGRVVRDPIRTSDSSTIHWAMEDPAVHALNRRLAALSASKVEEGEPLQILRYRPGEQYRSHLDHLPGAENHRLLTALIYLNDDYEGGETLFVRTGLKVKGRKGDALVFRNLDSQRRANPLSEHAGLPVTKGVKYLASRWIRERRWTP